MPTKTPRLPFEIDDTIDPTLVTGRAGVPLVIELFRQLGVAAAIDAHVPIKQRQRGGACAADALAPLGRAPACLAGPGTEQDRPAGPGLAGD